MLLRFFEYGKTNDGYWDGVKLHIQVVSKALLIAKALLSRILIFVFV